MRRWSSESGRVPRVESPLDAVHGEPGRGKLRWNSFCREHRRRTIKGVNDDDRGDDRDKARQHLIALFSIAGPDDPAVASARRALASALF